MSVVTSIQIDLWVKVGKMDTNDHQIYRFNWPMAHSSRRDTAITDIIVVGCGGTGGFLVESLCRMCSDNVRLTIIDHDKVEPHNLLRQNFIEADLGMFKSEALAMRMADKYRGNHPSIQFSIKPYDDNHAWRIGNVSSSLIIGCVDNALARQAISESFSHLYYSDHSCWMDIGNGQHSGQIFIGNRSQVSYYSNSGERMHGTFDSENGFCTGLPIPSWQEPALLLPTIEESKPVDCAQAVDSGDQSPVINQFMATLALDLVRRIMEGTLTWMGLYTDLKYGYLRPVPIDLATVSRITRVHQNNLLKYKAPTKQED